jgi:hypothetical protein
MNWGGVGHAIEHQTAGSASIPPATERALHFAVMLGREFSNDERE